jgi:hypothetical protein
VLIHPWLDSAYNPSTVNPSFIPHPSSFRLSAFPNPFNPATRLSFDLPQAGMVSLTVYDLLGRRVAVLLNERMTAGSHEIEWQADAFSSGMYFAVLRFGEQRAVQKMLLMK